MRLSVGKGFLQPCFSTASLLCSFKAALTSAGPQPRLHRFNAARQLDNTTKILSSVHILMCAENEAYQNIICTFPRNTKASHTKDSFHLPSIHQLHKWVRDSCEQLPAGLESHSSLWHTAIVQSSKTKAHVCEDLFMHFNKAQIKTMLSESQKQ